MLRRIDRGQWSQRVAAAAVRSATWAAPDLLTVGPHRDRDVARNALCGVSRSYHSGPTLLGMQHQQMRHCSTTASAPGGSQQTTTSSGEGSASSTADVDWTNKDFYVRLGVGRSATDKEIRARYIELTKRYHPDLVRAQAPDLDGNGGTSKANAEEVFKAIKEAYEVLSDKNKRAAFDAYGSNKYHQAKEQGFDFTSDEFARQQALRQLLADGLPFFIASVFLFLAVMAYHFRTRIGASSIGLFVLILVIIGAFPRLLAAALMYLMHCNDMIGVYEAEAQAKAAVSVVATPADPAATAAVRAALAAGEKERRRQKPGTTPAPLSPVEAAALRGQAQLMNVLVRLTDVPERHAADAQMVVRVQRHRDDGVVEEGAQTAPTTASETSPDGDQAEEVFVFAKGIHSATIPLLFAQPPPAASVSGSPLPPAQYALRVQLLDDNLKLTILDKKTLV